MMALTEIVRRTADYVLGSYLDSPTPPSLEMLSADGERESVTIENKTCFVYVLLSSDGKRYSGNYSSGSGFSIPALPKRIGTLQPTFRHRVRNWVRPEPELQNFEPIEQRLQEALSWSGIIEYREGVYGIFGITEPKLRHLLYVPAKTSEEADLKIDIYRAEVNAILEPHRIGCERKIKPLIKPGKILMIPDSLKESYFGPGC